MTLMMTCPSLVIESDFNIDSPCMGFELTEDEVNYIKQVEDEEKKQRADDAQRGREIMETFLSTSRAARCASRRLLNYKPGECTTTNRLRATIAESFATDYLAAVSTSSYIKNSIELGGLRSVHVGISCVAMEFDDEVAVFTDYDLRDAIHTVAELDSQLSRIVTNLAWWPDRYKGDDGLLLARILHLAMAKGNDYAERLSAGKKFIPIGEFATLRADPICTSIFEDMTKSAKENKHTFQPDLKIALKRGSFNSIEDRVMLLGKLRQTRAFGTNFFSARRFSMT